MSDSNKIRKVVDSNNVHDSVNKTLLNKVAIITGATSGIGFGIALILASKGCKLVITGSRSEQDASETLAEVF